MIPGLFYYDKKGENRKMNTSGEAAEQVMRMSLEGAEILIKLTGSGAKNAAVLLYSIYKEQNKTRGKERLTNMLRSGKPLKVYTFKRDNLEKFKEVAKEYGILYVRMIPDYPSDRQFGAFYDAEENCVYAKRGMGYEQIFTDVAVALAHAEMAKDIEGYLPAEHQFEARCAAYVLAKKYGVPTKAVEIDRVPEEYGVMDAAGIRENLARIHDSVKNISSGMYKALVKEKEQEVSPKEKPGKGGDVR